MSADNKNMEEKPREGAVVVDSEKRAPGSSDGSLASDEPAPHLHAKTFLAVFAVAMIYAAQLFSLIGAGAVSCTDSFPRGREVCSY